jgi:hypothetical protein
MAIFTFKAPNGKRYTVSGSEGATQEEALDYLIANWDTLQDFPVTSDAEKEKVAEQPVETSIAQEQPVVQETEQPVAEQPESESGDFSRGFQTAYKQLPQLGYGLEAGALAAGESILGEGGKLTELKKEAVSKYEQAGKELETISKPTDSPTYSFEKAMEGDYGSLVDTLQYGLGYGAAQLSQGGIASLGGKLVGKAVARATAENIAEKMVAEEAAKLSAQTGAEALTQEQLKAAATQSVANKMGDVGSKIAIGSQAFGMEAGEIGGELAKQSVDENRTLTNEEVVKGLGSAIAATALEYGADRFTLGALMGRGSLSDVGQYTTGVKGKLARGAALGASAGGVEFGTEFFQSGIEQYGQGKDILSNESLREDIDSAILGSIGGGAAGVAGGMLSSAKQKPDTVNPEGTPIAESMLQGGLPTSEPTQPQTESPVTDTLRAYTDIFKDENLNPVPPTQTVDTTAPIVDNETIAKDVINSNTLDDALQTFNNTVEANTYGHEVNMEYANKIADRFTGKKEIEIQDKDYQDSVQLENQLSTVRDELAYKKFQTAFEESNQQASKEEFDALVEQEIQDKNQQLKSVLDQQSTQKAQRFEASVPSTNTVIENEQWARTRNNRNAVIQMVFDRNLPAENIFPAIKAELKRQGFNDTQLSQDDIEAYTFLKEYPQANVQPSPQVIPTSVNEMDVESLIKEKPQAIQTEQLSPALSKVNEWVNNGATYKNGMLFDSKGKKFVLNKAQRAYYLMSRSSPLMQTPVAMGEGTVETRQGQDQISGVEEFNAPIAETPTAEMPVTTYYNEPNGKYYGDVKEVSKIMPQELKPLNQTEINWAISSQKASGKSEEEWAKSVDLSEPIKATIYSDGEIKIQDGHHRYLAAKILNEPLNVELKSINAKNQILNDAINRINKDVSQTTVTETPTAETPVAETPTADYETRNSDRIARIKEAITPEEIQSIYAEETSDNERHFEGTRKAEIAVKDKLNNLERESANKKEDEAYAAGEWVFHFPTNSLSDANQMAKSMEKIEPKNEYRVVPWQNDSYLVQKRKIEATPTAEIPVAEIEKAKQRVDNVDNSINGNKTESFHDIILSTPAEYRNEITDYILTSKKRPTHLTGSLNKSLLAAKKLDELKAGESLATETPVAEPKGTINNPILRKNGKPFTSPQGAQTHIRTNPELSKDTHTWVKLGDEKYGIVTEDQVVRKPRNPAANLNRVNGTEELKVLIGKLGGLDRTEMADRGFTDYKKNIRLFNNGARSRTFDDMATLLNEQGFSDINGANDLETALWDSLNGKPYYGYEGIDNAVAKMLADREDDLEQQQQDKLLNTYTNEEVNAILDAKTQAEKDKIIADIKAEKKRKADLEVDTVVDEMLGKGMTTSGDLFAPERKGKATVGREVTIEGEQLANSPLELKKLYPNHWFYGDKGAQSKFDETEIDYETQYPNLESVSLINTDSNIGGFYDQVEQAIYQTSQSDRTTLHELGHAIHHQLLNYRKLTEDERATLKELILGDAEANHPYLASDKELVAEFNLYAHVFPVKAKAYAENLYKELVDGRKDVSIKLGSQDNKALTAALKQANVTIEKGYGEETDNLKDQNRKTSDYVKEIDDYTKKEYVKQKLASNPKGDVEEITKQAEREHRAAIELRVAEGWGIYGANFEDYLDIWEKRDSLRKKYKEKEAKANYTSKLKESSLENRRNKFLENINDPSADKTYKDRFYKEIDSLVKYLGFEKFKNTGVFTIFKNSKDEYLVFNNPNNFLDDPNMVAFDKKGNTLLEGSLRDFAKALSINGFGKNHNGFSENDLKQIAGKIKEVYGDLSKLNGIVWLYSKYSPKNINEFTYDHPRFGYDRTDIFKYEMSKAIPNLIKPSSLKFSKAKSQQRLAPNGKPSNLNAVQYEQVRTPEFKEWFGDWENDPENASKVVDENGEPLVVYHGTISDFTEFSKKAQKQTKLLNDGVFYFSANPNLANKFAKNIKLDNKAFELWQNAIDDEDEDYANLMFEQAEENGYVIPVFLNAKFVISINKNNSQIRAYTESEGLDTKESIAIDKLKNGNTQGVIFNNALDADNVVSDLYVVSEPNQIKSATGNTGAFSKESNDIRFSKTAKKVLDENPLAIIHNLSLGNLAHADKMGGIAVPSVAIVNQKYPLSGFGEITLIGNTSQFAPEVNAKNKYFNADVYSPRYPQVTYVVDSKTLNSANESLSDDTKELAKAIGYRGLINASSIEDRGVLKGLQDSVTLKYEFLKSIGKAPKMQYRPNKTPPASMKKFVSSKIDVMELKNDFTFVQAVVDIFNESIKKRNETLGTSKPYIEIDSQQASNLAFDYQYAIKEFRDQKGAQKSIDDYATSKLIREKTNQAQYEKWLVENYSNLVSDERIFNGYTSSGKRVYLPHNLDTVVKLMTKTIKGGENVSYGIGTIRAYTAKQFKTVKQIQDARGDIVSDEKLAQLKEELESEFNSISDELRPYSDYSDPSATDALSDLVSKGLRAFKESYQNVPEETMSKVYSFLDKLKNMPAHYFEGKIGRAVDIGEFSGALVPKGKEYDEAVKILNANGITKIKRYTEGDAQSRSDALLNFSDLLFGKNRQPATNTHTEQSLKEGLTKAGDDAYGKGWTDRLLGTGMFKIISDEQAQAIIENAVEVSYSKNGDIEAFYNPADGKTYFVAENIDKEKDLHYLMMHEVSVHALNMGGNKDEFEAILKQVDNLVKVKNPAAVKGRQDALDADTPQEDLREETLAYLIKYAPKLKIVQRFKAWLKNALRNMSKLFPASQKLGFIQWANNLSDQDLLYIAEATLRKAPEMLVAQRQDTGNVKFSLAQNEENLFNLPAETKFQFMRKWIQDDLLRIRIVMDKIREQGGKVDESNDVVLAMEAAGNIAANQLESLKERFIQPLIDRMAKMNVNKDEIGLLLYAKHAPERNAYIQSINPKFRKLGEGGSGMTDKESAAIIERYKETMGDKYPEFEKLVDDWQNIQNIVKRILVQSGDISPEQAQAWDDGFDYHVPLKGFEEVDEITGKATKKSSNGNIGQGFSISGKFDRRALGRQSRANQIVENIVMNLERAVIRSSKMYVQSVLYKLIEDNPDANLWETEVTPMKPIMGKAKAQYVMYFHGSEIGQRDTLRDARRYVEAETERTGQSKREYEIIKVGGEPQVTLMKKPYDQNEEISYWRNGKQVRITVNDPEFVQAFNRLGDENIYSMFKVMSAFNRFLRHAYTILNPVFIIANGVMVDPAVALYTNTARKGFKYASTVLANTPMASLQLAKYMAKGTSGNAQWDNTIKSYLDNGGKSGTAFISSIEQKADELNLAVLKSKMMDTKFYEYPLDKLKLMVVDNKLANLMKYLGEVGETATRLSTFKVAVDKGMSPQEAAKVARNVTINFNRRGIAGRELGAMYLFLNASIQGTENLIDATIRGEHKAQATAILSTYVALGYLIALLGGDDGDDDLIPEEEKNRYVSIVLDKETGLRVNWKLAYGLSFFKDVGTAIYRIQAGGDVEKITNKLMSSFFGNFAYVNPMVSGEWDSKDLIAGMIPTFGRISYSVINNRNQWGKPIYPEDVYNTTVPDSEKEWSTTRGTMYSDFAKWMNKVTGGTKVESGLVDISPETMKYLTNALTGSAGTQVYKFVNSIYTSSMNAEEMGLHNLPVVSGFVKENTIDSYRNVYNSQRKEAKDIYDKFKKYEKLGDDEATDKFTSKHQPTLDFYDETKSIIKEVKDLRDKQDEARVEGDKALVKELEAEEKQLLIEYSYQYNQRQ